MLLCLDDPIASSLRLKTTAGVWPASTFGRQLAALISKLDCRQKTAVDIACGSGIQGIVAAKCGATVAASDISAEAVDCTLTNAQDSGVNIEGRVGSGVAPWAGRRFDLVICNGPTFEGEATGTPQLAGVQRLKPLPMITLEVLSRSDELLNSNGRIVGLVCGPYSSAIVSSAAAEYGLGLELVMNLHYTGTLRDFGGSFETDIAARTGFAEFLNGGNCRIRATAFVLRRLSEIGPSHLLAVGEN